MNQTKISHVLEDKSVKSLTKKLQTYLGRMGELAKDVRLRPHVRPLADPRPLHRN